MLVYATIQHPRNGGRIQEFINLGYMTLSHKRPKVPVKWLSDKNCLSYKPDELNSVLDPNTSGRREEALQLSSDLHIHTVAHLSMHAHTQFNTILLDEKNSTTGIDRGLLSLIKSSYEKQEQGQEGWLYV